MCMRVGIRDAHFLVRKSNPHQYKRGLSVKKVEEVSANEKQPGSRDLTERDLKAGLIYRR